MKINCLSCGHAIFLDEAYNDFEGPVKCYVCSALLQIRTEEGKIKGIRLASAHTPHQSASNYSDFGISKEKQA